MVKNQDFDIFMHYYRNFFRELDDFERFEQKKSKRFSKNDQVWDTGDHWKFKGP